MSACRWCGSHRMRPCSREGNHEYALSLAGLFPHKCAHCHRGALTIIRSKTLAASLFVVLATFTVVTALYAMACVRVRSAAEV